VVESGEPGEDDLDVEVEAGGEHSHGDKCLWPLNPHTEAKHRLYKRYISAWAPILLQEAWVHKVTYLEGFAGPGEYAAGQDGLRWSVRRQQPIRCRRRQAIRAASAAYRISPKR